MACLLREGKPPRGTNSKVGASSLAGQSLAAQSWRTFRIRFNTGWKLGKGFTLYPISLLSRALRASNFTRPSARGELAYRQSGPQPGFCQSKRRVLWALCPTHLTGSGRMRGSPVPPNTLLMSRYKCACQWCVCCPYRTQAFPCPGICALLLRMREGCALSIACIVWGDPV